MNIQRPPPCTTGKGQIFTYYWNIADNGEIVLRKPLTGSGLEEVCGNELAEAPGVRFGLQPMVRFWDTLATKIANVSQNQNCLKITSAKDVPRMSWSIVLEPHLKLSESGLDPVLFVLRDIQDCELVPCLHLRLSLLSKIIIQVISTWQNYGDFNCTWFERYTER